MQADKGENSLGGREKPDQGWTLTCRSVSLYAQVYRQSLGWEAESACLEMQEATTEGDSEKGAGVKAEGGRGDWGPTGCASPPPISQYLAHLWTWSETKTLTPAENELSGASWASGPALLGSGPGAQLGKWQPWRTAPLLRISVEAKAVPGSFVLFWNLLCFSISLGLLLDVFQHTLASPVNRLPHVTEFKI